MKKGRWAFFGIYLLAATAYAQPSSEEKLDPKIFESYLGSYQLDSGELITIGRTERRLYYFEPDSGQIRGLKRETDTQWSAGPSLLIYTPVQYEITFTKNTDGAITGLVRKHSNGKSETAQKASLYKEEQVTFNNGKITLSGTILIPSTPGPHPAVVFIHGSGPQDRNGYASLIRIAADHFARNGITALIYDKRGSGSSSGNWASATFDDLAADAISGLQLLQQRKDIPSDQVGLWGSSQAGWIMAKATSLSKDIAFIISVSAAGSGYTVAQQELYNVESEMRANNFSKAEIDDVLTTRKLLFDFVRTGKHEKYDAALNEGKKNEKIKDWLTPASNEIDRNKRDHWFLALDIDFDPLPMWEQYDGPLLAIFGELDTSTPVREVVPRLAKVLGSRKNTDFTITVFPKAHHLILESKTGSDSELEYLKRYVPGYFDQMSAWINSRFSTQ